MPFYQYMFESIELFQMIGLNMANKSEGIIWTERNLNKTSEASNAQLN